MSLVNDVLRDLDRRHATDSERGQLQNDVRPLPALPKARLPWRGIGIGLLAVLAAAAGGHYFLDQKSAPTLGVQVVTTSPSPSPLPVVEKAVPPAPTSATLSPTEPASSAAAPTSSPSGLATEVAQMPAPANVAPPPSPASRPASEGRPAEATAPPVGSAGVGRLRLDAGMRLTPPAREAPSTSDELQRAQMLLKLGRADEAEAALRVLLQTQPGNNAARTALLGVLLPAKRHAEAIQVLREGLRHQPDQLTWSMNLARLLVDTQDYPAAWETLAAARPHAAENPDYYAFAGTVLQRLGRATEAVGQFDTALRLRPREARWWVGFGIALESAGRSRDALEAFARAKGLGGLSPEVQAYVEEKLR